MTEHESVLKRFGGVRRIVLMTVVLAFGTGLYHWQSSGAGDAMREVGAELGLKVHEEGQRRQLRGRIDDIGIAVGTTTENRAGDTRWFTDFVLHAPDQPMGRIVGASLRQKAIGTVQGAEWLRTGDPAFDEAVLVTGDPAELSTHLGAEARAAILAATDVGWVLEDMTWTARKSGRMVSAQRIRSILELGLAAARATRRGDVPAASMRHGAETDVSSAARATADAPAPVTPDNALEALAEVNTPRSLEAAMLLARTGDHRQEVRVRLVSAVIADERRGEVIGLLGEIGGPVEVAVLSSVTDEHEEAAKAAIAAIEERL